jgi:nucleotide-binding universal stress UspA family protein
VSRPPEILVAVDFSPSTAPTLREAGQLGGLLSGHLTLVHVFEPRLTAGGRFEDAEGLRAQARAALQALAASTRGALGYSPFVRVELGQPAEIICTLAERFNFVVLGTQGQRGSELLGSVVEQVLRRAACTTLVVQKSPRKGHGARR